MRKPNIFRKQLGRVERDRYRLGRVQRDSLAVGFTVGLYGFSFGAVAAAAHATKWQAVVISFIMFSGGSQFALVGALAEGATPVSAVAVALFLGVRNALYAVRLRPVTNDLGLVRRLLAGHFTIDESTAMSTSQSTIVDAATAFWWTGACLFFFWNSFTFLGALSGSFLKDPATLGLTAAAPAAFLALLWPRLVDRTKVRIAATAAVITLTLLPWAPRGVPVLASLAAIPIGLNTGRKIPSAEHHAGSTSHVHHDEASS